MVCLRLGGVVDRSVGRRGSFVGAHTPGTITDVGEVTHGYADEGGVKMSRQDIIEMIERKR